MFLHITSFYRLSSPSAPENLIFKILSSQRFRSIVAPPPHLTTFSGHAARQSEASTRFHAITL